MGIDAADKIEQTDCGYIERNKADCPCITKTCANVGICCDCISRHRQKATMPKCLKELTLSSERFREHLTEYIGLAEKHA